VGEEGPFSGGPKGFFQPASRKKRKRSLKGKKEKRSTFSSFERVPFFSPIKMGKNAGGTGLPFDGRGEEKTYPGGGTRGIQRQADESKGKSVRRTIEAKDTMPNQDQREAKPLNGLMGKHGDRRHLEKCLGLGGGRKKYAEKMSTHW